MKKTLLLLLLVLALCVVPLSACHAGLDVGGGQSVEQPSEKHSEPTEQSRPIEQSQPTEQTTEPTTEPTTDGTENTSAPTEPTTAPTEPADTPTEPAECTHTFGQWAITKPASCKEAGERARTCVKCAATEKETVAKSDTHTPVTDAAVPATCKTTGLTEGSHCSVCNKVLVKQDTLPISDNHEYTSEKIHATPTTQGYYQHTCKHCGKSYVDGYVDYKGTESLTYKRNGDGTCLVTGITDANETEINIPATSPDGDTVIGIQARAFMSNRKIKFVIGPDTVKTIGEYAFGHCDGLVTVSLPGAESIGKSAFSSCISMKSMVYSDLLTAVGEKAFYGCLELKECRAVSSTKNLDTITTFGYYAFAMSGITNPTFSADLTDTSLANSPFANCKSLGVIDFSAATLSSVRGFSGTSFTELIFPKGITTISRSCFASCNFKTMTIPDSVTLIDTNAFYNTSFTKVNLGKGVQTIGSQAFADVRGECEINLTAASNLQTIGYEAFANTQITSMIIPGSVQSIGEGAFSGCTKLKTLGIPFISTSAADNYMSTNCFGRIFSAQAEISNQDDYIPSSLKTVIITADSVKLERGDFAHMSLSVLVLPREFTCEASALDFYLSSIYYLGTADEFPDISNAAGYTQPTVYYYSEKQPTTVGKYWHYVNGVPTAW